jgi:hypothetical protein
MSPLNRELIVINFFQILFLLQEKVLGFLRRSWQNKSQQCPYKFLHMKHVFTFYGWY